MKLLPPQVFATLVLVCCIFLESNAQIKATTADGKKVILNSDGTWKYDLKTDSLSRTQPDTAMVKPPPAKPPLNLDCSVLVSFQRELAGDKYVGVSKKMIVSEDSKTGFTISFVKSKNGPLIWTTDILGGQCVNEENKMTIVFTDGMRLLLGNDGKSNCEGTFTLYFGTTYGKEASLELFKTKEIAAIRVFTAKSYVESNFSEENALKFKASLNCIIIK